MKRFEVAVHNKDVRALVQRGERHRQFRDSWSDTHYVGVSAHDADDARQRILQRYPPDQGFVIEQVVATDEHDP